MLSPIAPPPTPILEGAGHLVVDCEPMLAVNTPPQYPVLKIADRESCIWITNEVEVTHEARAEHEVKVKYEAKVTHKAEQKCERTLLDISQLFHTRPSNNSWKLFYVTKDEFEADNSDWGKIASTPGIYVLGKRPDGHYEVTADESHIPWLLDHNFLFLDKAEFEFLFRYDPTQPMEIEVEVYGVLGARRRFYASSLENAFKAIWSRRNKGLKLCLRSTVPPFLKTALEWAILSNDILESSPLVREKFTLCLVLLALSLLEDYNTPSAIQLLEKNQDGVLQAFRKDSTDLFKAMSAKCQNRKAEAQLIGLVRRVFIFADGLEDVHQLQFDQEYTAIDNHNLLGSLVGVTGSSRFRNFDLEAILNALSRSKAITNECIDALDIAELISQLTASIPIGFQSNLGRPTEVPLKLPLRSRHYAPPNICSLRVPLLGDGVYELEKGFSDRKLRNGDVVKLRLGGVVTGSTSQTLAGNVNMRVPSALEDDRLMTLFVDYDGWYEDHQGTQQCLSDEVLRVVQEMKVGQKVLITEEKEDRNPEEEKEDNGKETRIWVVQVLQVLRVCAGHLGFGQNVPFHRTILGEKPKMIKRGVRQLIRKKLEEPRVACSACGLGRIFSSICCKFLGKSSNRGYVAL
ncbi:hypothetical protein IFR04_014468 [Cadophora malorum]|uniref:Uncharacterized protein n=1 Tax=Cadophora malorum TaxID=108018 RepID=A0A8H7T4N2_9HELO|nr:hypothetical protein IFR04_014468 [Cadophora malorum]